MDSSVFQSQDCKKLKVLQGCSAYLKASVYVQLCGPTNTPVIVKDFSHSPFLLRATFCRLLLNREIKALMRLNSVSGVPKFLGRYGQNGFVMELVEGVHPTKKDFQSSRELSGALRELLKEIHASGVTHNDVRMKNIIISNNKLFMIDYAAAFTTSSRSNLLNRLMRPIFCALKLIDESKVSDLYEDKDSYTTSTGKSAFFYISKKMHIIVDGWKYILKLIRKVIHSKK